MAIAYHIYIFISSQIDRKQATYVIIYVYYIEVIILPMLYNIIDVLLYSKQRFLNVRTFLLLI